MVSISLGSQSTEAVFHGNGTVIYGSQVDVNINLSKVIGTNNLSLGFMLEHEWQLWRDRYTLRQLTIDAGFKMVRLFSHRPEPCTYWNDATETGTFNWANMDSLIQRIFEVGAEPLITLGYYNTATGLIIPPGMAVNPSTGLPYPNSWAAYCNEWVKHFEQTGKPVRFYEIINEPWMYFGWNDYTKLSNYMAVFNSAVQAMKTENSSILVGFDGTSRKPVLDYWLANGGADLDFISFHKYDSGHIGRYSDEEMFARAETFKLETSSGHYGVKEARQKYYDARGKLIPVINSESNFNSAWETGADPKTQQMVGAVWTALVLRTGILEGLNYNVYFTFSSSASWERENKASGGVGFGMVNHDDNQPWYPYYMQSMVGNSLSVGDLIVESISSSNEIRVLSWIHEGKLNMLLICRVDQPQVIYLQGTSSQMNISKIDTTISWETPSLQTSMINSSDPLIVNGYTVMWLKSF